MKSEIIERSSIKLAGLAAASILFLAANQANAAAGYTFHDLGTAGGPYSIGSAINNAGQIVGTNGIGTSTRDDGEILTVWTSTTMTNGDASRSWAINSSGQIAGANAPSKNGYFHASTWDAATLTRTDLDDLANRQEGFWSVAQGINDAGQVVGAAVTADNTATKPLLWNNAITPTILNTLGGVTGEAWDINNGGLAVGSSFTTGDTANHATRWNVNDGTVADLGVFAGGGTDSVALAINDGGQIAGWSNTSGDLAQHAAFWNGDAAPVDLGTLGGANSQALALNGGGDIVGWSEIASSAKHAAFWDGTTAIDLNTLLDSATTAAGWVLVEAQGINDNGAIVGYASNSLMGIETRAYLLSPVPEPETYAMLLAGLGLMGALARRRKAA